MRRSVGESPTGHGKMAGPSLKKGGAGAPMQAGQLPRGGLSAFGQAVQQAAGVPSKAVGGVTTPTQGAHAGAQSGRGASIRGAMRGRGRGGSIKRGGA